jgi:ABC-type branched-subunit amino acid transport system substrate-binding protein
LAQRLLKLRSENDRRSPVLFDGNDIQHKEAALMAWSSKFTAAAAALALMLGIPGIGSAAQTVTIGNIIPLSGPSAPVGVQGKNAREMAVQEINAAGGIKSLGGAKLKMIYADSKSDPTTGVSEAERLINSEKVNLLTGCWNSAVTYPTTQVAERYGIPFVVPVSPPRTPGGPATSSVSSRA